jgi:hypothetical protein
MSYPVQNLIEGRGEPVCVRPDDPVQRALELMTEHDFSQLPVVNEGKQPLGMVTHASILRALANFGVKPDQLLVNHAMIKPYTYRPEEDLFDLLDRLRDTSAILIVDGANRLIGIVTSYDSTEYFRRRAEDMMLVEDIESTVKDMVQAALTGEDGEIVEAEMQKVMEEIISSKRALMGRYRNALQEYLALQGQGKSEINQQWLKQSFSHLAPPERPRAFEELTLYEYTELLLHKRCWDLYRPLLNLECAAIRKMLNGVRETRNALAHFRGEISPAQRDQLKFCSEWLENHPIGIPVSWSAPTVVAPVEHRILRETGIAYETSATTDAEITPTEEELSPRDSRYAPLAIWLQSKPSSQDRVQLTFQDVEEIMAGKLPPSARRHRAWWANDSVTHTHSRLWLEVGWRVARVNMTDEMVTFARIKRREEAYIRFFSAVQQDMRQAAGFPLRELSADGQSWQTVATLPEGGPQCLYFVLSFTRGRRFRAELYIDTTDQGKNKFIFDQLQRDRARLEASLGTAISWERLDQNRASRIAVYHPGSNSITDGEDQLAELRAWAVDTMLRFYQVLADPANQALDSVERQGD